jgi:hypothetical protein
MMIYFFAIDFVLSTCAKVLAHIIPAMEKTQDCLTNLKLYLTDKHFLFDGYSQLLSLAM